MTLQLHSSLSALVLAVFALPAISHAQIRVDSRIHTSSGSCASCDLSNKTMTRLNLNKADFSGSNFYRSNLSGGTFIQSNLKGAQFRRAYLVSLRGDNVDMSGANFVDATLTEAALQDSMFTGADLRRADLTRVNFAKSDFTNANLISVIAPDANFTDAKFINARLDHINLQNAVLSGSNFTKAHFGDAALTGATLNEVNLSGADLRAVQGLTQAQLDTACGTPGTRLPLGLSVPYCDSVIMADLTHDTSGHNALSPQASKAAQRLDTAITQIETLMGASQDKTLRRELQSIHANLVSTRRNIER